MKTVVSNPRIEHGSFKLDYRDYTITYAAHDDTWYCYQLDVSGPTLTSVKKQIANVDKQARDIGSIPLIHIDYYGGFRKLTGVLVQGDKRVWCMVPGRGNEPPSREKKDIDRLALDNAGNNSLIAEYHSISAQIAPLEARRKAIVESIPKVTVEELKSISTEAPEED